MERVKRPEPRSDMTWIIDTLSDLFASQGKEGEEDSDSNEEELIATDPMNTTTGHPNARPEIHLTISRNEIRQGFKFVQKEWQHPHQEDI